MDERFGSPGAADRGIDGEGEIGGKQYDLVIVGFGPTGAAAANLAGRYGLRTLVIERELDVFPRQRAMVMDDHALRILSNLRLYEEATAGMHLGVGLRFLGVNGREFMSGRAEVTDACGEPQVNFFHQPWLEEALRKGVERWPCVEVLSGWEAGEVIQDAGSVTLTAKELSSGTVLVVQASYLLACDGASSPVRKQLGLSFEGTSYPEQWIDVQAVVKRPLKSTPMFEFFCDPARPGVAAPCPAGHYRWEWRVNPGESADALLEPESMWRLLAARGVTPEDIDVKRTWSYTFHIRKSARWRQGRVILAGDAAHVMPPFAGAGISEAFRDVMNVMWKVAAVVNGSTGDGLLDSYQVEREPQHDKVVASAVRIGRMVMTRNRLLAWVRDNALRAGAKIPGVERLVRRAMTATHPLEQGYLESRGDPSLAGHLLRATTVAEPGLRMAHVDDALGSGWAILGLNADPRTELSPQTLQAWSRYDPRYLAIRPGNSMVADGELGDPSGLLWEWMTARGVHLIAVRPDRYVYAAAPSGSELAAPMETMRFRPGVARRQEVRS